MRARRRLERLDARGAERLFGNSPQARLALVRALWPRVVGPELASRTEASSLTGDLLRVRVTDVRWMRVLHRLRFRILGRLKGAMGTLAPRQLGFLDGLVPAPEDPGRAGRPTGATEARPPPALRAAVETIPDPELRAAFLGVAARYLERARRDL
jgi:hypothetical protein